jgi:predicted DNA-binding transcriptional regulator AlpA
MKDRFVFKPERRQMTGVSDPTWWRMEKRNEAPQRRQISPGRVAWLESEIVEWMQSRPACKIEPCISPEEIG